MELKRLKGMPNGCMLFMPHINYAIADRIVSLKNYYQNHWSHTKMSLVFLQTEELKFSRLFMTCAFLFDRSTLGQTNQLFTTSSSLRRPQIQINSPKYRGLTYKPTLGSLRLHQRSTKKKFELLTWQIYQKFELPKDFLTVRYFTLFRLLLIGSFVSPRPKTVQIIPKDPELSLVTVHFNENDYLSAKFRVSDWNFQLIKVSF